MPFLWLAYFDSSCVQPQRLKPVCITMLPARLKPCPSSPWIVQLASQVDCRFPHFSDSRERIARACLFSDPFLFGVDDIEQKFLVLRRRHVLFQVIFVG